MTFKLATRSLLAVFVPVVLAAAGTPARAQPAPPRNSVAPQDPYDANDNDNDDESDDATLAQPQADEAMPSGVAEQAPVQPTSPQPTRQPPPPPVNPPPLQAQAAPPAQPPQAAAPGGQWVYTPQYGWLWMPYGNQYVYSPEGTAVYPSEYVYRPAYGWVWLSAPWVWGWGPRIHFSVGPRYFGWYHRGFVRHGVFRGPGFRSGFRGSFRGSHFSGHFGGHRGRR
jgi:hypothetical protein